ncbi:MAG TPA: M2 family metallopeptidase [Planctomycetota bacterium]|nr:M2 family metallopeptidase [Planctomycetota bacterium]
MKTGWCAVGILAAGCSGMGESGLSGEQASAQEFLDGYSERYQELYYRSSQAEWASNTRIVEGDETNARRTRAANGAMAAFTGSAENIAAAREWLAVRDDLSPLQVQQLEKVLFLAGNNPATVPELVSARIAAETAQTERLYGFEFRLEGQPVTTNGIDELLRTERDLGRRRRVWEASKEVGTVLKPGLMELRRLRNSTVRALGYADFFAYMASEYGVSTEEMEKLIGDINRQLRPLFRELHTWARHELAARYGQEVPDQIPAHWLPNRWGQDWGALVDVAGFDLDAGLQERGPEWLVHQAERFYTSLGFPELPESFWQLSDLYPLPPGTPYKKNNHASAWHLDLQHDLRSLMSVEPNTEWYETTHHELGHIYYYVAYTRPEVPLLLREGANRAFHEAVGSLMGLAAMQPRFVAAVGLAAEGAQPDPMQLLLKEALNYVVFIPWSAGTMFQFEKELYADDLPPERWNERWWELVRRYQGVVPPAARDERFCDAATKTHINDDPAGYYDYALSYVLLFQLHDHVAREILGEDPHDTNYFGRRDVGEFLESILREGSTRDWQELLREATGSGLSAGPMLRYFEPLRSWLVEQNRGRQSTLAEL